MRGAAPSAARRRPRASSRRHTGRERACEPCGRRSWPSRPERNRMDYAIHFDRFRDQRLRAAMGFLQGRRILVTGMLSNRSIAYGIAKACAREGAELAFTYQGEGVRERVADLAREFGSERLYPCDVADDAQIDALFAGLRREWDGLDGLVHA